MKTNLKLVVVAVLAGSLAACAVPDRAAMDAANYGDYPANYQDLVSAAQEDILKDPQSAQNKYLSAPQKGWMKRAPGMDPIYGYRLCLNVNAKNSFGGYIGYRLTEVFIRDGHVIRYRGVDKDSDIMNGRIKSSCSEVVGRFDKPVDAQTVLKTEAKEVK